ncbi:MAG: Asd/ArgC dimerization domain-containing protein, partial [Kangiellaceae bacterium]
SGYSGAGTKPSPNNNPNNLKDNILPYGLIEHLHEKEVSYQLKMPISFSPHVAAFFRGISMTLQVQLKNSWTNSDIVELFKVFYKTFPLIEVQGDIPNVQQVINKENCIIGGFSLSKNGTRLTLVSCLDNLLKGAASQALQNINLFFEK